MTHPLANVLAEVRRRIGPAPRRIPVDMRRHLISRPPLWVMLKKDELIEYYRKQELLLTQGVVGWGAIVQANGILFGPGSVDAPATMIYSTDPAIEADPERLATIASNLHGLRFSESDDTDEKRYGQMLADELERAMGTRIPSSKAEGLDIRSTTVMVRRKHLPGRLLKGKIAPVLTHPSSSAVMIVPSHAWPEEFAATWRCEPYDVDSPAWDAPPCSFTEEAVERFQKLAQDHHVAGTLHVRVYIDEPTDGYHATLWSFSFEYEARPSRHLIWEAEGVKFFIARSQADLFMGVGMGVKGKETGIIDKGQ